MTTRDNLLTNERALNARFPERSAVIRALILTYLAQENCLLLGPPGTAKTMLIHAVHACFTDARSFYRSVTKTATPDEWFGGVDIPTLKNTGRWVRMLTGKAADCEVLKIDEPGKGNDVLLNAFLNITNGGERTFEGAPTPCRVVLAASNEALTDPALDALDDRFLLRAMVSYVSAGPNRVRMLELSERRDAFVPPVGISLDEWSRASTEVEAIPMPGAIRAELDKLASALAKAGMTISDRRLAQCQRVLRAAAWLDGCQDVELDHLQDLAGCLWRKPEDQDTVKAALATLDQSVVLRAVQVVDDALRAFHERPSDPAEYDAQLPALTTSVCDAGRKVKAMLAGQVTKRARERIQPKLDDLAAAYTTLKADLSKRLGLG